MLLTITGLTTGQSFLGLDNGVHSVLPTTYGSDVERWMAGTSLEELSIRVNEDYKTYIVVKGQSPSFKFYGNWDATHFSHAEAGCTYALYGASICSITSKIKDHSFGMVTINDGTHDITISWQRCPGWAANPCSSSASSKSSSSSSKSSKSSSSSWSSGSHAPGPAPHLLLTISGLGVGKFFLGLGNGTHSVLPAYYSSSPEAWVAGYYGTYLAMWASTTGTGSNYSAFALNRHYATGTGSSSYDSNRLMMYFHAATYSTHSLHNVPHHHFTFTPGSPTAKVKNKLFGSLTTADGVTISWQRDSDWPPNPVP